MILSLLDPFALATVDSVLGRLNKVGTGRVSGSKTELAHRITQPSDEFCSRLVVNN